MALPQPIIDSLNEAESALRNALAFAARSERSIVCSSLAHILQELDSVQTYDKVLDRMDESGDTNPFKGLM